MGESPIVNRFNLNPSCTEPSAMEVAARIVLLTLVVASIGVGVGCRKSTSETDAITSNRPPNIVVFLVDTLRADRLGVYGYDFRPTSPRLDKLAADAVVFEQAYAPSPWTLPTVASMATSSHVSEHRVVDDRQQLPAGMTTVAERLAANGYLTMGLYGNAYAGPSFGLDRGFAHYVFSRRNDAVKVAPMLDLAAADGRPFLLYVHNMEPHGGERFQGPPQEGFLPEVDDDRRQKLLDRFNAYRRLTRIDFARKQPLGTTLNTEAQQRDLDWMTERYEQNDVLYDAAIRLADSRFGSVVDLLRERGLWDDTAIVFLSDHGEELGEHGGWQHDQSVYEELIRVPLVIRFPGGEHGGKRTASVVSLISVAPTLLSIAGVPRDDDGFRGRDLLQLVGNGPVSDDAEPVIVAVRINRKKFFAPWKAERGDLNIALREGSFKAIANIDIGTVELYDLDTDPGEQDDIASEHPDDAARLGAFAAGWLARFESGGEADASRLDDETLDRLRSLGYVD